MKVFIHVVDLVGPHNACIGMGQMLENRGHQIYYLINAKFESKFKKYSDKFVILKLKPVVDEEKTEPKDPITQVTDNFIRLGFFDPLKPVEKIKKMFGTNYLNTLPVNAAAYEGQIKAYVQEHNPDVFIVDAKIMSPCIMNCGIPWIYLFCPNPLGLFSDERLPPFTSGLAIDSDPEEWKKYREVLHREYYDKLVETQKNLCTKFGYPAPVDQVYFPRSPYMNIYQYPAELDYDDTVELPKHYQRVDEFVRNDPQQFVMPESLKSKMKPGDKLIFLSMGSMGSCNLELMRKLVSILAKTPYYYIVSKGLLHEHYQLADNMWGEQYIAQTRVLPLVDLVIFHGGNNTLVEAIFFGKPMIVMPLFYDQYDNAQRVMEKKFGIRLDTHSFTEEQLISAIDQLINDDQLNQKLKQVSQRIQNSDSRDKACEAIENIAKQGVKK